MRSYNNIHNIGEKVKSVIDSIWSS